MRPGLLYLASASPRRAEILRQLGVGHEVLRVPAPPGEDEPRLPGESPDDYVRRTARDKALGALRWLASGGAGAGPDGGGEMGMKVGVGARATAPACGRPVLAADTTVALDGDVLGKPADAREAAAMLGRLSGRVHRVLTAVVLAHQGRLHEACSVSRVRFRRLSPAEILDYCAGGEPMGKAGAYGIQGRAAVFVAHLAGSYTGVMGLPACETWQLLADAGLHA